MPDSLTSQTVHGLKWTYASTIVNFVLQVGVTAVLARILAPKAFGTVAMAGVFISLGQYFAQLGVGQAVVQRQHLSAHDVRTAFTSSVLLGVAFCALFVALSPLVAVLFPHTHGVVPIARVMSLTFVLGGLTATTQGLLQRRMAFRSIALIQIVSYVLGYAVIGLVLASTGFGAWSLVAASLAQGALAAAAYTTVCRADIGFGFGAASLKSLYSFGGRVSLIGFAEFVASNLDTLWTGHFLGARATGLYTRATNIATVPLSYLVTSLTQVLLPGYSRIQSERRRLKSVYLTTITVFGVIMLPISWGVAASAHEIVLTLLGGKWAPAAPVLAILALAAPFSLLTHFGAVLCEATATLNVKIIIQVGRVAWLAALLVGLTRFGIAGIAAAFALSELVEHVAYLVVMRRLLTLSFGELWRAYVPGLAAGALTGLLLLGVHAGLIRLTWPAPAVLVVQLAVGVVCLFGAVAKARGGAIWQEVRGRLSEAGYRGDRKGVAGWAIRRLDALS